MSTQPVAIPTTEAKPRLQLHAFRHGLTNQVFVMSPDESAAYRKHSAEIRQHYQPVGPIESSLADQVAAGIWRLQRSIAIEEGIFAMDAVNRSESEPGPAYTWIEQDKAFHLLNMYENRIRRALDRDKAELQSLQSVRKDQASSDMNQAVALHNLAKTEGQPYEQATPSVFSKEEVRLESARREALAAAQARLKLGLK